MEHKVAVGIWDRSCIFVITGFVEIIHKEVRFHPRRLQLGRGYVICAYFQSDIQWRESQFDQWNSSASSALRNWRWKWYWRLHIVCNCYGESPVTNDRRFDGEPSSMVINAERTQTNVSPTLSSQAKYGGAVVGLYTPRRQRLTRTAILNSMPYGPDASEYHRGV